MAKSTKKLKKFSLSKIQLVILAVIIIIIAISAVLTIVFRDQLRPVSSSQKAQIVTIKSGSSLSEIAHLLKSDNLIRSSWALQVYVDTMNYGSSLQAGTYALAPDQSTQSIVKTIVSGSIQTNLVTIIPGKRVDQVKDAFINYGYSPTEVDNALNFANYTNLPIAALVPSGTTSIEGLLWPDSFARSSTTPLSTIITESLNEMYSHLTPTVQAEFASEGLSTYQGLTLTSIINQEVSKPSDQTQVAQVFLSRLKSGAMLQSNVTAYYGAIEAGQTPSINYSSLYNTYQITGLPPTPISTIGSSALYAATHPANTHWAYFVTGDNGDTYFSATLAQQQSYTSLYCHQLCSQ